jgi:hypothetical protein
MIETVSPGQMAYLFEAAQVFINRLKKSDKYRILHTGNYQLN